MTSCSGDQGTKKLFGLQFKSLYKNGEDVWNISETQHERLQQFDWMYYGLSDLTSASQQRTALHYLRIKGVDFPYQPHLTRKDLSGFGTGGVYSPLGGVLRGIEGVPTWARRIHNRQELHESLWPYPDRVAPREIVEIADEVLLSDFQNRRAIRYSSVIRP